MTTRSLKILTITAPVLVVGLISVFSHLITGQLINWPVEIVALLIIFVGSVFFSHWIFRVIDQREAEIQKRSSQLTALHEAALTLTMELDLGIVLQKVVDEARTLANAQYGALGVLSQDNKTLEQFITSGIPPQQRAKIGPPPQGRGLLGIMTNSGKSIRISSTAKDARAVGFPPEHPDMKSLLGVPIKSKGKVIGNLYLTNKISTTSDASPDDEAFSERDQQILEMFATQAAIAIENAQLYRQTQQLAIFQERERFGMDLHDGVIQSIYAIGLMLEDTEHRLETEPESAVEGINRAIHGLNDVIRDIRNYILDLRPQRFQGRDLWGGLEEIVREFRANTFLDVDLDKNGSDLDHLSPEKTVEILHIAQEALTNVRKHARATEVSINLSAKEKALILTIEDNGIGMDMPSLEKSKGNGVHNMQERASSLHGSIQFGPCKLGGTCVTLYVPMSHGA